MKKALYVLFAFAFLSLVGIQPAHVQAAAKPTSLGYLALLSPQADASQPVEAQARDAFQRLLPRLVRAQAKGQITAFKPEYAFGVLKVQYPAGTDLAAALASGAGAAPKIFDTATAAVEYSRAGTRMQADFHTPLVTTPYMLA